MDVESLPQAPLLADATAAHKQKRWRSRAALLCPLCALAVGVLLSVWLYAALLLTRTTGRLLLLEVGEMCAITWCILSWLLIESIDVSAHH